MGVLADGTAVWSLLKTAKCVARLVLMGTCSGAIMVIPTLLDMPWLKE